MVSLSNHEAPFDSHSSEGLAPAGNVCILTQTAFYIRLLAGLHCAVLPTALNDEQPTTRFTLASI